MTNPGYKAALKSEVEEWENSLRISKKHMKTLEMKQKVATYKKPASNFVSQENSSKFTVEIKNLK